MKNKLIHISGTMSKYLMPLFIVIFGFYSCKEYSPFDPTGGMPEVYYVRLPDIEKADSLIDGAFLETSICLVGNNLRSVYELYFNDQKATLNTNFITDNTLVVAVPSNVPYDVTDQMYLITRNNDVVTFPFKSKVPSPAVNSMKCEYVADGDIAEINGNYFIDDPNIPLTITMAGNIPVEREDILSIDVNKLVFKVPAGSQKGYINVSSIYGTGRSHFQFRDDRGIILDWDALRGAGWRAGNLASADGISGNYVVFKGDLTGSWSEDDFSFNLWGEPGGRPQGDFFDATKIVDKAGNSKLLFKFEINILAPWTRDAMQIVFTSWATANTNGYYSDDQYPRALWIPWATTGSYMTEGWTTVTIPMADFKFSPTGRILELNKDGNYGGLSMFIWNSGGIESSRDCTTEMWLDNIRVVPVD